MWWFTGIVDFDYDFGHVFISPKNTVRTLDNCFCIKKQENILCLSSYVT